MKLHFACDSKNNGKRLGNTGSLQSNFKKCGELIKWVNIKTKEREMRR